MVGKRVLAIGVLVIWLFLFLIAPVSAYLDPGSGSLVCQVMLAGAMAFFFTVKLYWRQLKTRLVAFFSRDLASPDE